MFFLVPLIAAAASTISAGTIATGVAVAVTGGAIAAKKIADSVEKENCAVVEKAKEDARKTVQQAKTAAQEKKEEYKAQKGQEIQKHLDNCDMKEKDKEFCSAYLSKLGQKEIGA